MIDPIDRAHLDEMTDGDDEFARELIGEFVRATDVLIVKMKDALQAGDKEGVRLAAHAVKGSALSVGAMVIGDAARSMEDRAADGDLSGLESELAKLTESFAALKEMQS